MFEELNAAETLLRPYREQVKQAIRAKKVFTMVHRWMLLVKLFEERGWEERIHPNAQRLLNRKYRVLFQLPPRELIPYLNNKNYERDFIIKIIKSNLMATQPVDFIWFGDLWTYSFIKDEYKVPIVNKLKRPLRSNFSTKPGLAEACREKLKGVNIPRSYLISTDWNRFWHDFNLTAAMSLLKYVVHVHKKQLSKVVSPSGQIPYDIYTFAYNTCSQFVKHKTTSSNREFDTFFCGNQDAWNRFHEQYFKLIYFSHHFKQTEENFSDEALVEKAKRLLSELSKVWPDLENDGHTNIWLLKPFANYGGNGIHLCRTRNYILNTTKNADFVIQKYIERPLLIFNTKFDIRQWYVVTKVKPLTIWMWKECFLRFSRETFNIRKLHEKIHLTNTAVQDRYWNNYIQDTALPQTHLWTCEEFKSYLSRIGYPKVFNTIIYPGMKETIVSYTKFHKDKLGTRNNCFELFGADFLISGDFKPWLLENNHNPALADYRAFFTNMIYKYIKDILRVVIDNNEKVEGLELIYREK